MEVILHYKFTAKERDAESGLDNFGARYDGGKPLLNKAREGALPNSTPNIAVPRGSSRTFLITFFLYGHHRHRIAILQ